MTDNEIIKAVECCINTIITNCDDCPYFKYKSCTQHLTKDFFDLINRQKAEIERLKKGWKADVIETSNIKAEAIKEFAERLPELIPNFNGETTMECVENAMQHLVKEMVGDSNV